MKVRINCVPVELDEKTFAELEEGLRNEAALAAARVQELLIAPANTVLARAEAEVLVEAIHRLSEFRRLTP